MLDALQFVASAVAKKDYVPELTHFRIKNERVTGFNGMLALSSPIGINFDAMPLALPFIKAIRACDDTTSLHMTPTGRLAVKAGKFKAYIQCMPDPAHTFVAPEGDTVDLGEGFLAGLKKVAPIMGIDASRPWSMSVKLFEKSIFATNNVMLAEYWHGVEFPRTAMLPAATVHELIRINEDPISVQMTDTSISFWFENERWLRSQLLLEDKWPQDKVGELMSFEGVTFSDLDSLFVEHVDKLKGFLGDEETIYLSSTTMGTHRKDNTVSDEEGASFEIDIPQIESLQAYSHRQLTLLGEIAKKVNWAAYPRPCQFSDNENLRGVILGKHIGG